MRDYSPARLTRSTGVDLAEHHLLQLVVQREHTSTSNTTEDVGTSTLEEGLCAFLGDDLVAQGERYETSDGAMHVPGSQRRTWTCS